MNIRPSIVIVSLCIWLVLLGCDPTKPAEDLPFIAVDQVGYNSDAVKQAFLVNAASEYFEIVDAATSKVVFQGSVGAYSAPDVASGDSTRLIDFTEFTEPGTYRIRSMGLEDINSQPFTIGHDLYQQVARQAVQSFYYNRCGTTVDNGKPWRHSICHLGDGAFYDEPSKYLNTTGGWHDAGDYNKYSINTELSVALLLYLHEVRPRLLGDGTLDIPEAKNGIPDVLDEARWALKWLIKMQASKGGVYHKVSQKKWAGEFLPHKDPETRYIFEISSNATGGFAATAALASRLFAPYDPSFAQKLSDAAQAAWRYLERHPKIQPAGGFKNPPDVSGGEYGDTKDTDVRMWAAVELYKLTGDRHFLNFFVERYPSFDTYSLQPLSWKDFSSMAFVSFLDASVPAGYESHQAAVLRKLEQFADARMENYEQSNYKTMLGDREYYWGSNSVALGYGYLLSGLYRHTGDQKYYKAALDQLHYNLGRNALDQSFVTGVGSRPVQHPYHQFSMKLGYKQPVPGMLVGGPNDHMLLNGDVISRFPAKSYEDTEQNYYVNEVAINWTAILAYSAAFFTTNDEMVSTK